MINILSASAGSGKTTRLSKNYIELLLKSEDRYAYRHILAVTFTNKATDEMKSRILDDLHLIATDPNSCPFVGDFIPGIASAEAELSAKAGTVLCNILHDYSAFAVSTIDKFFQQTLKAFSRELGQFAAYLVELDKPSLISESVDRVLDSLTGDASDKRLLNYLTGSAIQQVEEGRGNSLERLLKEMAQKTSSEEHRVLIEKYGLDENELYSEQTLGKLQRGCSALERSFREKVRLNAHEIVSQLEKADISLDDLSGKAGGFNEKSLSRYLNLKEDDCVIQPSSSFVEKASDPDTWFNKAKSHLAANITTELETAIREFLALFGLPYREYCTAGLLKEQVKGLGIASDIRKQFQELLKEKNVMCLDDSNAILKNIIDGTDAPFIYEKIGVRFEHFLLDEFQDTSKVQWDNFRPLLRESVSNGMENLVVGDVKQSIYRWRGSDWNLLDKELPEEFSDCAHTETLDTNWRSFRDIVEFNNDFFEYAAKELDKLSSNGKDTISNIYKDVRQKTAPKNNKAGYVRFTFCDASEEAERTIKAVQEARDCGFEYRDIGILVRNNSEGGAIAASLLAEGIQVVTDDSLQIKASLTVRRLIALLTLIDNPNDKISSYLAHDLEIEVPKDFHSVTELCEDLLRKLKTADPQSFENETLYIQSFMDLVHENVFIRHRSLHDFLKAMKEDNSKISSPSRGNAVRVMTIHKAKGLAFPYVIIPYLEKITFSRNSDAWCKPPVKGTALESFANGIYNVNFSSKTDSTLFREDRRKDILMQYIDNINVAYVAFTRAREGMHIICSADSGEENFAGLLHSYADGQDSSITAVNGTDYVKGTAPLHKNIQADVISSLPSGYDSWESGARISISTDAGEYFSEDGSTGISASARLRGIVLHDILSSIRTPADLKRAIKKVSANGDLNEAEIIRVQKLLSERIESACTRGWFPQDGSVIINEVSIMGPDGVTRPDRVIVKPDSSVTIIDYKFGVHKDRYVSQILSYADAYKRMGYNRVSAFLWYVVQDEVITVLP